ncbi:MAG: hypothetical protein FWD34_04755 [Oscillospiraceae bacterium]|nr:hypothetical protein [Oscillospiraceae bacterium]
MKKVILSLITATFILTACNSTIPDDRQETGSASATTTTETTEATTAVSETVEPTVTEEPLKQKWVGGVNSDLTESDIEIFKLHEEIELWILEKDIDISLLSQLDSLETLSIIQSAGYAYIERTYLISDFSFLKDMTALKSLYLDYGGFDFNINDIIHLNNLEKLTIASSVITLSERIDAFPQLKELTFWQCDIETIDLLCDLEISKLSFYGCGFQQNNLNGLSEINTLEELHIDFGINIDFTDFENLRELTINVQSIDFSIELLYELTQLEVLTIRSGLITNEQCVEFKEKNPGCDLYMSDGQSHWLWESN